MSQEREDEAGEDAAGDAEVDAVETGDEDTTGASMPSPAGIAAAAFLRIIQGDMATGIGIAAMGMR